MERQSPSILDEILHKMTQADVNFAMEQIPSKVLMLMGDSKAGKTTLLYYLLGKPLHQITNELGVTVLEAQTIYNNALIGTGYESTTVYPNIPPDSGVQDLLIIDMPGSNDTRVVYRLLNIYILLETIKLIEKVHLCIVIPEYFLEPSELLAEFQKICGFVRGEFVNQVKAVSFIITKVQDDETLQKFDEQIKEFIDGQEYVYLKDSLQKFLSSNKYVFKNEQPVVDEGIRLKGLILEENRFVPINRNYKQFLSQNFCRSMVGNTQSQDFYGCIHQIIGQMQRKVMYVVKLTQNIIYYQYSEIFAFFFENSLNDYEKNLKSNIDQLKKDDHLSIFEQVVIQPIGNHSMSKEKLMKAFKIFNRKNQQIQRLDIQFYLKKIIESLIWDETWTLFSRNFISSLQQIYKHFVSLLIIIKLIDDQAIRKAFEQFNQNSEILTIINQFYLSWENNQQYLINNQTFRQILKNPQFNSLYKNEATKIRVYTHLQHKDLQVMTKKIIKTKTVVTQVQNQTIQQKWPQGLTESDINQLPRNRNILSYIFQWLKKQNVLSQNIIISLVNVATDIFIRFSLIEEAIVFKLSVSAFQEVGELLDYGTVYSLISSQFVSMVLVPFYEGLLTFDSLKKMQICYRYLQTLVENEEEFVRLNQQFLGKESMLKKNIETSYSQNEKYLPINFSYIHPILQSSSIYLQYLSKKQMQFQKSHLKKMTKNTAFQELNKRCI